MNKKKYSVIFPFFRILIVKLVAKTKVGFKGFLIEARVDGKKNERGEVVEWRCERKEPQAPL